MKIPRYARYGYCYEKSCEFLEEFKIKSFPINLMKIVHQRKWGITPYSELMDEFHCDRKTAAPAQSGAAQQNNIKSYQSLNPIHAES